jgi:hypothetical protein
MRVKKSDKVEVPIEGALVFAESMAKRQLRSWGFSNWRVKVRVTSANWDPMWQGRGYSGRAWRWSRGRGRVLIRISPKHIDTAHVHVYPKFQNMPAFTIWNRFESMVYIAAHEFGHIMGYDGTKDGEAACCRFGYAAVEAWRDRQCDHPACLI